MLLGNVFCRVYSGPAIFRIWPHRRNPLNYLVTSLGNPYKDKISLIPSFWKSNPFSFPQHASARWSSGMILALWACRPGFDSWYRLVSCFSVSTFIHVSSLTDWIEGKNSENNIKSCAKNTPTHDSRGWWWARENLEKDRRQGYVEVPQRPLPVHSFSIFCSAKLVKNGQQLAFPSLTWSK